MKWAIIGRQDEKSIKIFCYRYFVIKLKVLQEVENITNWKSCHRHQIFIIILPVFNCLDLMRFLISGQARYLCPGISAG